MADMDDFDLDRSTAQAWSEFASRLSEVISMIDESADLRIGTASTIGDPAPFVTFSSPADDVVRVEAASNAALGEAFQLTSDRLQQMQNLGWEPPEAVATQTANFWVEDSQDRSDRLSELVVAALKDVYGVQHPVFLAPDQLAEVLQPQPTPVQTLSQLNSADNVPSGQGQASALSTSPLPGHQPASDDVARPPELAVVAGSQEHLNHLVEAELSELFGYPPIRDDEGDIAIRVGTTMVFLRTSSDGREIVIFAAVVHDVAGRSRAAEVLNDLNVEARWVKFQLIKDRVFVTYSLPTHPFVPAHLRQGLRIMSDVADGIDEELATKLHGRTTFPDRGGT